MIFSAFRINLEGSALWRTDLMLFKQTEKRLCQFLFQRYSLLACYIKLYFRNKKILSHWTRKQTITYAKTRTQIGNCPDDQCLHFCYTDSRMTLLSKSENSKLLACSWLVLYLVRNPNCWFSHAKAHVWRQQNEPSHEKTNSVVSK